MFDFFFFSSRRRHTRSKRDWSSDVCSSDLDYVLFCLPWLRELQSARLFPDVIAARLRRRSRSLHAEARSTTEIHRLLAERRRSSNKTRHRTELAMLHASAPRLKCRSALVGGPRPQLLSGPSAVAHKIE